MTTEDVNKDNQTDTPVEGSIQSPDQVEASPTQESGDQTEASTEAPATEEASVEAQADTADVDVPVAAAPEGAEEESAAAEASDEGVTEGDAVATSSEESDVNGAVSAADGEDSEEAAPAEPVVPTNPNFKWYVVHTYSMYEEKAKQALLERTKQFKCEEKFGQIVVPKTASDKVLKSGKKKRVEKTSFPGYMIVQMEMDEQTNHVVKDTPKVTGFVGNAQRPRPITDQEVLRLTSPEAIKEAKQAQVSTLSFEKGENVKVTDGAFTNFDGIVEDVDAERLKLRILVSIFGRETPVELDYGQVQKLS